MIKTANKRHVIVFVVNMLSPRIVQVKMGKITKPVEDPINLADQAEAVSDTTILQAYQKKIEVGMPKNMAAVTGRFFHHSVKLCKLSWNQPNTCAVANSKIPSASLPVIAFPTKCHIVKATTLNLTKT